MCFGGKGSRSRGCGRPHDGGNGFFCASNWSTYGGKSRILSCSDLSSGGWWGAGLCLCSGGRCCPKNHLCFCRGKP